MVDLRLFFRLAFFLVVDLLAALDLMALAGLFAYASLICVSFSTFFFHLLFSAKMKTLSSSASGTCRGPPRSPSSLFLPDCSHLDQIKAWRVVNGNVFSRCRCNSTKQVSSFV